MSDKYPGGLITLNPPVLNPALGAATPGIWTLDQALNARATRSWPMYDPYYNNVVLNLHGNGTNGAQNNTFQDSSTNNFTITRNGNTTQGSFSPYGQGWSNYFDGSSSIFTANNAAFQMGSGDFTIEFWANTLSFGAQTYTPICGVWQTSGTNASNAAWYVAINAFNTTSKLGFSYFTSTQTDVAFGTATNSASSWDHYAVVRSGSLLYGFKNGVLLNSGGTAISGTLSTGGSTTLTIGDLPNGNKYNGFVSNLRITKGGALYTSNFVPSTSPLTTTVSAGTVSLLTCQSNRFIDNGTANSGNGFTFTLFSAPQVQRFNPFGTSTAYTPSTIGGSGYFDGSGDYLSIARNSAFLPGANTDFTFEAWVYRTLNSGAEAFIVGLGEYGTDSDWIFGINASSQLFFYLNAVTTAYTNTSATVPLNAWSHVAVSRSGTGSNNLKVFVNGVGQSFTTNSTTVNTGNRALTVASDQNGDEASLATYISNLRLINGTGVYTGNFTPPTLAPLGTSGATSAAAYLSTTNVDTSFSSSVTALLLNFTNAGIFDNAMMNNLETVGNAQISTSVKKYGTGSMAFDGTGDYVKAINTPNIYLGTSVFTIEFWFNTTATTQYSTFISNELSGGTGFTILINSVVSNGIIQIYNGSSGLIHATTSSYRDGAWHHLALVRDSSGSRLYVDGTQVGSTNAGQASTNFDNVPPQPFSIGSSIAFSGRDYLGYIDDLRITKGVARYVANFTPPTSQLQDQ